MSPYKKSPYFYSTTRYRPLSKPHDSWPTGVDSPWNSKNHCISSCPHLNFAIPRPLMICIAISRLFPICDHPFSLREQHNDNLEYLWSLKMSTLCLDNVHVHLHCNSILADHNSHIDQQVPVFFHIFANSIVVAKSSAETLSLHRILLEQRTGNFAPDWQHGQRWSY